MDQSISKDKEYYTIDLLHIAKNLWHRAWLIILTGIIAAAVGFSYSTFFITPKYSSSIMLYVNNSSVSIGSASFSISSSEISAAQSLVKTYIVMLQNRTTLEDVIEKADVSYTYKELYSMIKATSVNETEVMQVTVTSEDPYEAAKIVNAIAEVLPKRISEIIEGSSMEVVDSGIPDLQKIFPSISKYTAFGFLIGAFIAVIIISVIAISDDTIHDEEYILQTYNYPILAKVPDLLNNNSRQYSYYYQQSHVKNQ